MKKIKILAWILIIGMSFSSTQAVETLQHNVESVRTSSNVGIFWNIISELFNAAWKIKKQYLDVKNVLNDTHDEIATSKAIRTYVDGHTSPIWDKNGNKVYYNDDNVWIGTNNPNSKLEVNGWAVRPLLIESNGTPWALTFRRSDLWIGQDINIFNNSGQFYVANRAYIWWNLTLWAWGTLDGDSIRDNTLDSSEIQNNSLTTDDILNNTITETDISDSFVARSALKINTLPAYSWMWDMNTTPRSIHNKWIAYGLVSNLDNNAPINYGMLLNLPSWTASQDWWAGQILFPYIQSYTGNGNPMFRVWWYNNQWWATWKTFLDKDWGDSSYINVWETWDLIADNTIDSSEIENNTLTQDDLAANSVWNSELIDTPTFTNVISNTPTVGNHLATKTYVDDLINGLTWKEPVAVSAAATYWACNASKKSWTTYNKADNIIYVCNGTAWVAMSGSTGHPNLAGEVTWSITSNIIANNVIDSANVINNTLTADDLAPNSVGNSELVNNASFSTLDVSGGTSTPLLLQTSTGWPWAMKIRRTDLWVGKDINLYNNNGQFYVANRAYIWWNLTLWAWWTLDGDSIRDNTLDSSEIQNNTLTADDLAPNSVWISELVANSVNSSKVADNTLTADDLAPNSVWNSELIDIPTFANVISNAPTLPAHLATKAYVDANSWGGGSAVDLDDLDDARTYWNNNLGLLTGALVNLSTGIHNIAIWEGAAQDIHSWYNNTAIWSFAMQSGGWTTYNGFDNVAIWTHAMVQKVNIYENTAIWSWAMGTHEWNFPKGLINGNTTIWFRSLYRLRSGWGNVAIWLHAWGNLVDGSQKLFIDNTDTNSPLIWWDFWTNKVYINGGLVHSSDRRLKKDIVGLENSLENIKKLRWVNFTWKETGVKDLWVIAQEVEKVYPRLVDTDDVTGFKSVAYSNMVAILIEGMKEQQTMIEKQWKEIEELRRLIESK